LTEVELGTSSPLGEDAMIEERDDLDGDEGKLFASKGSRGAAAAGCLMERTLAEGTNRALDGDGDGDGDGDVGRRREKVAVVGAEVGDERAEGGDVRWGVRREEEHRVVPFEMGELEYLRHIPSFRIGERELGGMTLRKTEGMACEEGSQATAGKSETDGLGSRGLRVAWWKMGFAVRGTPSLGVNIAEQEQGRRGGLESQRVMRRCVSS